MVCGQWLKTTCALAIIIFHIQILKFPNFGITITISVACFKVKFVNSDAIWNSLKMGGHSKQFLLCKQNLSEVFGLSLFLSLYYKHDAYNTIVLKCHIPVFVKKICYLETV